MDDLLRAGDEEFKELCKRMHENFGTSGDKEPPLTFAGSKITKHHNGTFSIDQTFYLRQLEELDAAAKFTEFRSMRMKVAWLANTRPDLQFEISQMTQVAMDRFSEDAATLIKRFNVVIRYARNIATSLKFPRLDMKSLRVVGYSDAAFANNQDLSSQLGRIILLMDGTGVSVQKSFKSYKSLRVTRSVLSAEIIAFDELFDDAFAIRHQLEQGLRRVVLTHLLTDSKSLFDIISKGSRTS